MLNEVLSVAKENLIPQEVNISQKSITHKNIEETINDYIKENPFRNNGVNISDIIVDNTRDELLTDFGKATLKDRYLLPDETFQGLFARVATAFADNLEHAQRLYDYMSRLWFMPSTPILSNANSKKNLPISCFLNSVDDSMESIANNWLENTWLSVRGGGLGTSYSNVRAVGEKISTNGKSSGIIPYIKVQDSLSLAISQGCFDDKTEILTEKGWMHYKDLFSNKEIKVYQVNNDFTGEFVNPINYYEYDYNGEMYNFVSDEKKVDFCVTPTHRVIMERLVAKSINGKRKRFWKEKFSEEIASKTCFHKDNRLYHSVELKSSSTKILSFLDRLMIAYQADGSSNPCGTSNGKISGNLIYNFHFTKERKIIRMCNILDNLGFTYTKKIKKDNTVNIAVRFPISNKPSKLFSDYFKLDDFSLEKAKALIDEIQYWDGFKSSKTGISYSSVVKENIDFVQAVACLCGYKTRSFARDRSKENRQTIHSLYIISSRNTTGGGVISKTITQYNNKVWCVSVPSGMVLIRRNGATCVSGNSLRSGSAAIYLDVSHPEIEEFLEIRKPSGDFNRKSLNLHQGLTITDEFMNAVKLDQMFPLRSPKTKEIIKEISARELWQKILEIRLSTGEPYLVFIDRANENLASWHKMQSNKISMSNLCSEILLPTGIDHINNDRTAVCCLSSMNLETWYEWKDDKLILEDVIRFLDNVLEFFIHNAPEQMNKARYSAIRERSIGLGVMGFHSLLQSKLIPIESVVAKSLNNKIFSYLKQEVDLISKKLGVEKGACQDAQEYGYNERFSYKMAIAPTASISIICGGTSAGIEPIPANIYTHKTLSGSFPVKNKHLIALFESKNINNTITWQKILSNEGSIQTIDELSDLEKDVFKTAFEIDQRYLIELAADRTKYICQSQSLNLFIASDVNKWDLMMIHYSAWQQGIKSLYYLRSKSIQRAAVITENHIKQEEPTKYDECLSCQ